MIGSRVVVALVSAVIGTGEESPLRIFALAERVEIGVPMDWDVARERELRDYERVRDQALEREGLDSGAPGLVEFQAAKKSGAARSSVMLTFLPPEASQEEVSAWSPTTIEHLAQMLGKATGAGLAASGSRDISVGEVARVTAGGKMAVRFNVHFTGSDSRRHEAEKYFIYTSSRTVVLTLQWTEDPLGITQRSRDRILESLKVE